jgi:hypothetical protein
VRHDFHEPGPGNLDAKFNTEVTPMLRTNRTLANSLAVFLVVSVMASSATNAFSLGKKTKTDASAAQGQGASIAVQVFNRGDAPQNLKVDGKIYTVQPHQALTLKGTPGTDVYADTAGNGYQKGDMLFKFAPMMNGATVKIN